MIKKKVFITGASGFIGKSLVKKFSKKYYVVALTREKVNADALKKLGAGEVVVGDIENPKKFSSKLNSCQVLIHLAALRSNWMPEEKFFRINSDSLTGLLKECKKVKHVIVTSSTYVHGFENTKDTNESFPLNAKDLYGKSKIKAEEITKKTLSEKNIPYTIIRPTVVYGPGDNESGMIMKLIKLVKTGKFFVLGKGKNKVQLIYVDDLADGYFKAAEKSGNKETYILAGKEKITMNKLAKLIQNEIGLEKRIPSIPKAPLLITSYFVEFIFKLGLQLAPGLFSKEPPLLPAKVRVLGNNWTYDITKAAKELNFHPKVNYKVGLKKTIQ